MNSVSLFYPVLPQILLLQPPAWQSKRVLNGRKEIKWYNLFSTNVVWSHLGLGFFLRTLQHLTDLFMLI